MAKTRWILIIMFLVGWPMAQTWAKPLLVTAARIWPADEYTRVTLESRQAITAKFFTIDNPNRLVLDLTGVTDLGALTQLSQHLSPQDPYIRAVRVAHFNAQTARVVFDLKTPVKASSVLIQPVASYGYRFMLDLYPETPSDPLMSFLAKQNVSDKSATNTATNTPVNVGTKDSIQTPSVNSSDNVAPTENTTPKKNDPLPLAANATPELPKHAFLIAVDAGHGGEDPGAHGHGGHNEKDVTLAIARHLTQLINQDPDLKGVLVRDGDYFIPLQGRTAKARRLHADMFVSIHADAYINEDAKGSSVFALSEKGATSVAAKWLAQHENDADLIGGVDLNHKDPYLAQTLFDLSQTATINDSLKLAQAVLGQLHDVNDLHRGHVEQAGFAVLKSPDIPSILVETAFITNPTEERRLTNPDYQDQLAHAILKGIKNYMASNPATRKNTVLGTR